MRGTVGKKCCYVCDASEYCILRHVHQAHQHLLIVLLDRKRENNQAQTIEYVSCYYN